VISRSGINEAPDYQDQDRQASDEAGKAHHSCKKQGLDSRTGSLSEAEEEAGGLLQARSRLSEVQTEMSVFTMFSKKPPTSQSYRIASGSEERVIKRISTNDDMPYWTAHSSR